MTYPILYSFRRCPYAMRARLAIRMAQQTVELREIVLKDKPEAMLAISPKGTVPVLQLPDGRVIDESRDIMLWALEESDPENLLPEKSDQQICLSLIDQNDGEFKSWLDRYKYADRYPEKTQAEYRQKAEHFLQQLERSLVDQPYLLGQKISLVDIAIMPFVRQFAHVNKKWFASAPYPNLQKWLDAWLENPIFLSVMAKYQPWQEEHEIVLFKGEII